MPGRTFLGSDNYRYSVNGMEKSPEIASGHNTSYFRELDARTGRWWSVDPVWQPWQSSYNTFDNNPVALSDPSGALSKVPGKGEEQKPVEGKAKGGGAGGKLGDALRSVADAVKNGKFDGNAGRIETSPETITPNLLTDEEKKKYNNIRQELDQSSVLRKNNKRLDDVNSMNKWGESNGAESGECKIYLRGMCHQDGKAYYKANGFMQSNISPWYSMPYVFYGNTLVYSITVAIQSHAWNFAVLGEELFHAGQMVNMLNEDITVNALTMEVEAKIARATASNVV